MLAILRDGIAISGFAAVTFGLWQVYPPAAWIFGGSVVAAFAIAIARSAQDDSE